MKRPWMMLILSATLLAGGCADPKEKFGRTWYIDGAGNLGFGLLDVPIGLEDAGYKGVTSYYRWSLSMNPAFDQTMRFIAKGAGQSLGNDITQYLKRNPDADANIIALSAGTGVGIWALENIKPPYKANNYIMLGSSLSSSYDCRKALANMKGKIYVYCTSSDPVLQGPVRALGTIDGTFDDSAGLIGLQGPGKATGRVVNIGRTARHADIGWTGGHADCTNRQFVKAELSRWIVRRGRPTSQPVASRPESGPSGNP